MPISIVLPRRENPLESLLTYLPCAAVMEYRRGQTIYYQGQYVNCIYLVIGGRVKISRFAHDGEQIVIDVYGPNEFFGESALLNMPYSAEHVTAMENSKLMMWTASAIQEIAMRRPRLAVALLQILVERTMDYSKRVESLCADNSGCRLARSLIRFSERLGIPQEDGSVQMKPFPHELLAHYVGMCREVVTYNMNQFRRDGFVQYSRKEIVLHPEALGEWLQQNA